MKRIATLVLTALAPLTFAQTGPPSGHGGRGGPPMGRTAPQAATTTAAQTETLRLLGLNKVQNELGLTLSEWTALNALARAAKTTALTEDQALAAVAKILTTEQTARLTALLVQSLGYNALVLSSVRAKLELTAEQATSVTALMANLETVRRAVTNPQTLAEVQKTTSAALAKLLTAEQDVKLRALAGRPLQ